MGKINVKTAKKPKASKPKSKTTKKKQARRKCAAVKKVFRKNMVKGPKTAWIFFCREKRKGILDNDPTLSFGDICKKLSPQWKSLSKTERESYESMHADDKNRYKNEVANLTPSQLKDRRFYRKMKRKQRKSRPSIARSPYMWFVIANRKKVATENPLFGFDQIGRELGRLWNCMTNEEKETYKKQSLVDRKRYQEEMATYKQKLTREAEERRVKRAAHEAKKAMKVTNLATNINAETSAA